MSEIKLKKFKMKDNKISVEYDKQNNSGMNDEFAFASFDEPRPNLTIKLLDLRKWVCELCELPTDDDFINSIRVTGLSFSETESMGMGVSIVAQKTLKNAVCPLNLVTPHKFENSENDAQLLPSKCVNDLIEMREEIIAYIEGDRVQMNLFEKAG